MSTEHCAKLRLALYLGRHAQVRALLEEAPALPQQDFGVACALYNIDTVLATLKADPDAATRAIGPRRPILHLAFSRWHKARPDLVEDMLAVAEALLAHGADVNDGYPWQTGDDHLLSALYGAIGHADNMALGRWLLAHGANPNDNESLYHATELDHLEGLQILLEAGADPAGTNALLRALDFNNHAAVRLLLAHGAQADEFNAAEVGGEAPFVIPALHQAARRMCDAEMAEILLEAGADPHRHHAGAHPYAFARAFGNMPLVGVLEARGLICDLSREETMLARAADGLDSPGEFLNPDLLPEAYGDLVRCLLAMPGRLDHVRRLVALGLPYDDPDPMGVTPLHLTGWEGLPEAMAFVLKLKPDLSHVNGYGGTLLGTILHGSEHCPDAATRDHIGCLRLALEHGVLLPQAEIGALPHGDIRSFLEDWAQAHPGQLG